MDYQEKIKKMIIGSNYRFMLLAGEWKNWFTEDHFKMIIAGALNDCVYHEESGPVRMAITGYYISGRRVYLVLKIRHADINRVFDFFFKKVKAAVLKEMNSWMQLPGYAEKREHLDMIRMHEIKLFEKLPVNNHWLIQLIMGRKVILSCYDDQLGTYVEYFDYRLERLKKIISQEAYCSVIDYAGGEGPVIVTLLDHTEHI